MRNWLKELALELFELVCRCVMWMPFWPLRWVWLKLTLGSIGRGTFVGRNVDLRKPRNIFIGSGCVENKNVLLDGRGIRLVIGDNVDIAQEAQLWTLTHDVNSQTHQSVKRETRICDYVWIGTRATLLAGIQVNSGGVVGACSVVTKDVGDCEIVAGNPARTIRRRDNPLTYHLHGGGMFK